MMSRLFRVLLLLACPLLLAGCALDYFAEPTPTTVLAPPTTVLAPLSTTPVVTEPTDSPASAPTAPADEASTPTPPLDAPEDAPTAPPADQATGGVLPRVLERGTLRCGIEGRLIGFSQQIDDTFRGVDADFCRAVAAAVFGDSYSPQRVAFVPKPDVTDALTSLSSDDEDERLDVVFRNLTATSTRRIEFGVDFGPPVFHDGQTFLMRRADGITESAQFDGQRVCVGRGTTSEANLQQLVAGGQIDPVPQETTSDAFAAFFAGTCDAVTGDSSRLVAQQAEADTPDDYIVFRERISVEPLAPAIVGGDPQWRAVIDAAVLATIYAEERGITSSNVAAQRNTATDPAIRTFLGSEGALGADLGLPNDFVFHVLQNVGNYDEIYQRNLGDLIDEPWQRGPNNLVRDGGNHTGAPFFEARLP